MKENDKKKYMITYVDGSVSMSEATSILNLNKKNCKNGLEFLATDAIAEPQDVLHFESLGVSVMELSEGEKDALMKKDQILAIEEDIEVSILKQEAIESDEDQYDALFGEETVDLEVNDNFNSDNEEYASGYKQAILDLVSKALDVLTKKAESVTGFFIRPMSKAIPWNISLVKAPNAWRRGITGRGVKLAILDTGIDVHADLGISGGISFIPGSTSYIDVHGHGTHCAGIAAGRNNAYGMAGVAPQALLYAVKVLNNSGSGQLSWIVAGLEWCVQNRMKVASLSLGSLSAPLMVYATIIRRCQENGVTVVAASGNSFGTGFPYVNAPANSTLALTPSASPIAVGSVNNRCVIAASSSRGGANNNWNKVVCVAPGVNINSTIPNSRYGLKSGTSMACPHVAGLAALIIQRYPGISPLNVKRRIVQTCRDLGPIGNDITYGAGLIDCDRSTL